jgi:hypothetical protein
MAGRGTLGRATLVVASAVASTWIGDQLLRVLLVDCPTTYWLPQHAPRTDVVARLGTRRHEWTTNSLGFHDRDHARAPASGARRIVCIGDSFLDGPTDPSLPQLLESTVRARESSFEAINLSAPGIGPRTYLALLTELGLRMAPQRVLVFLYEGNDLGGMQSFDPEAWIAERPLFAPLPRKSWLRSALPHVATVASFVEHGGLPTRFSPPHADLCWALPKLPARPERLANRLSRWLATPPDRLLAHLQATLTSEEIEAITTGPTRIEVLACAVGSGLELPLRSQELADTARGDPPELERAQVAATVATLRVMARACSERGIAFGVVLVPTALADPACRDRYLRLGCGRLPRFLTESDVEATLGPELRRAGLEVLDLAPVFESEPGGYSTFELHWNERGVATAARAVAEWLRAPVRVASRN